tara:strand:+ start:1698 stop:2747 length:1050 start_codon:yes stop_codon:yes gene_type:complete
MSDTQWAEITVPKGEELKKVEYEIEGQEEKKTEAVQEEDTSESSWEDEGGSLIEEEEEKEEEEVSIEEKVDSEPEEIKGIKTKGAQKRIRHLVKQRKERDEHIQNLIQKNEDLTKRLIGRERQFTEAQEITTDTSEKQLQEGLELARTNYIEAYQSGDGEKVLKAQELLNQHQKDIDNVAQQKAALQKYKQSVEQHEQQIKQQSPGQQQADPRAVRWASDNEWFGKDNVMTAAALAIDVELKDIGLNPLDDSYYSEVDNRLRKAFPHKFNTQQKNVEQEVPVQSPKTTAQVVAGASRSSATSGKKVKLTQEDMRLAKKWDIPLDMYAAEKLKIDQSEGGYTDVETRRGG